MINRYFFFFIMNLYYFVLHLIVFLTEFCINFDLFNNGTLDKISKSIVSWSNFQPNRVVLHQLFSMINYRFRPFSVWCSKKISEWIVPAKPFKYLNVCVVMYNFLRVINAYFKTGSVTKSEIVIYQYFTCSSWMPALVVSIIGSILSLLNRLCKSGAYSDFRDHCGPNHMELYVFVSAIILVYYHENQIRCWECNT